MDIPHWWVRRAVEGDEICLDRICAQVDQFVRDFVDTHVTDPNDAADVSQAILVQILKGLPSYDADKGKFEDWVAGIVWRYLRRYQRGGWECPRSDKKIISVIPLDDDPDWEDWTEPAPECFMAVDNDDLLHPYGIRYGPEADEEMKEAMDAFYGGDD